jgi:hypothetical protein
MFGNVDGAFDAAVNKSDSAPLMSPLITSERPIVACSMGALEVFTGV